MVNSVDEIRDLYPFKSKFIKVRGGYNYHYIDEGEGEVILMLHGNPSWSFLFRNLIIGLRKNYRLIAPDHIGFGLSDKPYQYQYSLETHIDNLDELLEYLNLEKFTLLVHDWGGPVGFGCAERYPEKISRLIISNTAAFTFDWIPFRLRLARIPILNRILIENFNLFAKFATFMTTKKPLDKRIKEAYLFPFRKADSRHGIFSFVQDIPMWPEDRSYELLVHIEHGLWFFREKPICIIWGMKDWCFKRRFLKRWFQYYPEAECYKMKTAAHFLYEDEPKKTLEIISDFLKRNSVDEKNK